MGIIIRAWQKSDLTSIRNITWQSWISAYSSFIPESDLKSYFDIHYTEVALHHMLDDPFMYGFIGEMDGHIAGYARLFFNQGENRLYIPSFYFLPEFQGQGIGTMLMESVEAFAIKKGAPELWIGVMLKNKKALNLYRKVGFLFVREEPFTMGKTTVSHLIGYKKLGKNTFLNEKSYAIYDERRSLPELYIELLSNQKKDWHELREGYESLKHTRERALSCRGFNVRLQYNPRRIKSSMAEVDKKNMTERQCFLCLDHLPQSQQGILYRNDYLILCNPMPVFSAHFTISHLDHRHQEIDESIDTFLALMEELGPSWMVLYNGPRCGASAPDHLHFQTAPSGQMPIEKEIQEEKRLTLMTQVDGGGLYHAKKLGREVILLEGDDPSIVGSAFKGFLNGLKMVLHIDEEPMVNVIGLYQENKWRLVFFLRRKHRPNAFFKEGDERMVVSPGVIDMGGLLITPVERDFNRLDTLAVESIYREVSLEGEVVKKVIDTMG